MPKTPIHKEQINGNIGCDYCSRKITYSMNVYNQDGTITQIQVCDMHKEIGKLMQNNAIDLDRFKNYKPTLEHF